MGTIFKNHSRSARFTLLVSIASVLLFATVCSENGGAEDAGPDASGSMDGDADSDTDTTFDTSTYAGGECEGTATPCESLPYFPCQGQDGCTASRTCQGTPQQCATIIMTARCSDQQGCSWNGSCLGMAKRCNSIMSSVQCSSQYGCVWDINVNRCGGTAIACQTMGYENCGLQQGCNLTGSCAGAATGCGVLGILQCTKQTGCKLIDHCDGTPTDCEILSDWQDCLGQDGCGWI